MAETHQKLHAIMISFPFQGHINPFVNLAIKLASKGFTITFVHTLYVHHQITKAKPQDKVEPDVFAESRKSGLDIRYTTITDGLPLEFDRYSNIEQYFNCLLDVFPNHVDEFVAKLVKEDPSSIYFLVADTFCTWSATVAKKYNMVNVSFWTEPATMFAIYYHLDLLIENGHFAPNGNRKEKIDYIPGVQAIEPKDLMLSLQETDVVYRIQHTAFEEVKKADIVIINTVQEFEFETISVLHQKLPTYAIGPIFPPSFTKSTVAVSLLSESDCTAWLETKPPGSVLYVSFGSIVQSNENDLVEIAHGLLLSKVNFIWVLRPGILSSDATKILPAGFEDAIKDRGLILPWCSQIAVLSHPAVGGFLTHCGWNSVLESICCGVPLICLPFYVDQITNRKLVVDDWRVGINLRNGKSITREEVAQKIDYLMSGSTSEELRKEIKNMKKASENSLATDGSSQNNFDQFINDVKDLARKRNGLVI